MFRRRTTTSAARKSDAVAMGTPRALIFPEPPEVALLDQPLEYLLAAHFNQRAICNALRRFVETKQASREDADRVAAFLASDLSLHHLDEDKDLFPALRKRLLPEDELGPVLARLGEDHRRSETMAAEIVALLTAVPATERVAIQKPALDMIQAFVAAEHRHLAMENAIVLTIASVRLPRSGLKAISRGMKERRGIVEP